MYFGLEVWPEAAIVALEAGPDSGQGRLGVYVLFIKELIKDSDSG